MLKVNYYVILIDTRGYNHGELTPWERTQSFLRRIRFLITEDFYNSTMKYFTDENLQDLSPEKEERFLQLFREHQQENMVRKVIKARRYPKVLDFQKENFLAL
jgi:hypothetical protein